MTDSRVLLGPILIVVLLAASAVLSARGGGAQTAVLRAEADGARYRVSEEAARRARVEPLPAPGPLRFAPEVGAGDRDVVRAALAAVRPEARGLVDRVAGLTTVSVGALEAGVAGRMTTSRAGYDVRLDLGPVFQRYGMRGVGRVALHELAHVVDHALVTTDLERTLDAATPPGIGCDGGHSGACAAREERFAESFAKWATGDIGVDLHLGYRVPPPSLSAWGGPLATLTRADP